MRTHWSHRLLFICYLFFCIQRASAQPCRTYLTTDTSGHSSGIFRVESLLGRQTSVIDVSAAIEERRARTDPHLRVFKLDDVFAEGKLFIGFGRPNVYLGIPNVEQDGLGYVKVDAKSLKRADTHIVSTHGRVQSGLLMVFKDLPAEAVEATLQAARRHEGTRRWTCVNANCQILSDAGFTLGGQALNGYYFPVPLLKDILRYGLEFAGRSVEFDLVKTTPGYLEDIGLSINYAVWSTLCRHADKACSPRIEAIKKNTWMVKFNEGLKSRLGLAMFNDSAPEPLEKPVWESQITHVEVPPDQLQSYDLEVSEPSQLGLLLRLLWGPHSLFEIPLADGTVDSYLPDRLQSFPDPDPSFATRLKKNVLFNKGMVSMIRSQLSDNYRRIEGLTHDLLLNMLRTSSDEYPNKYNFVVTGNRLIVMKLDIYNGYVDWVMSKHVLMSGYSDDVRFAGEIWKTADGKIHFNNNSGTYKPGSDLTAATELFEMLFPGVPVEGHGI